MRSGPIMCDLDPYVSKFFHIIDSTGLTVRRLYFAVFFLLYGTATSPLTRK